jgi:hypothetical protein
VVRLLLCQFSLLHLSYLTLRTRFVRLHSKISPTYSTSRSLRSGTRTTTIPHSPSSSPS